MPQAAATRPPITMMDTWPTAPMIRSKIPRPSVMAPATGPGCGFVADAGGADADGPGTGAPGPWGTDPGGTGPWGTAPGGTGPWGTAPGDPGAGGADP